MHRCMRTVRAHTYAGGEGVGNRGRRGVARIILGNSLPAV
jgi:hypothetical protein